jgi:hypothetical protein
MSFCGRTTRIPESCAALDLDAVERMFIRCHANVTATARVLNVPIKDLRQLSRVHPRLLEAAVEAEEQLLDLAEEVVLEAIQSHEPNRSDPMARFVLLNHEAARQRGWGKSLAAVIKTGPVGGATKGC